MRSIRAEGLFNICQAIRASINEPASSTHPSIRRGKECLRQSQNTNLRIIPVRLNLVSDSFSHQLEKNLTSPAQLRQPTKVTAPMLTANRLSYYDLLPGYLSRFELT